MNKNISFSILGIDNRCGTNAGNTAHKRRKEISCVPCVEAQRKYMIAYDEKRRPIKLTPNERFTIKLKKMSNGCIEWQGNRNKEGYGRIMINRETMSTHRLSWKLANGSIPDGMCVLHKCDNPPCCNIKHLWIGTSVENIKDRSAKGRTTRHQSLKTHCKKGHPYDDENTYLWKTSRHCKMCMKMRSKKSVKP